MLKRFGVHSTCKTHTCSSDLVLGKVVGLERRLFPDIDTGKDDRDELQHYWQETHGCYRCPGPVHTHLRGWVGGREGGRRQGEGGERGSEGGNGRQGSEEGGRQRGAEERRERICKSNSKTRNKISIQDPAQSVPAAWCACWARPCRSSTGAHACKRSIACPLKAYLRMRIVPNKSRSRAHCPTTPRVTPTHTHRHRHRHRHRHTNMYTHACTFTPTSTSTATPHPT